MLEYLKMIGKGVFENFPIKRILFAIWYWASTTMSYIHSFIIVKYIINTLTSTIILAAILGVFYFLVSNYIKTEYLLHPVMAGQDLYTSRHRELMTEFNKIIKEGKIVIKSKEPNIKHSRKIAPLPSMNEQEEEIGEKEKIDNFLKKIETSYISGYIYFHLQSAFIFVVMFFKFYYKLEIFNPYPMVYLLGILNAWIADMRLGFEASYPEIGQKRIPVIICMVIGYQMMICIGAYLSVLVLGYFGILRESRCGVIESFWDLYQSRFLLGC